MNARVRFCTRNISRQPGKSGITGFTLIELMVVVMIISILGAIAMPIYAEYTTRGKIPEATAALANKRARMELFFDNSRTYVGAPECDADSTTSKYYTFSCTTELADAYVLEAVGTGSMAGFTFTIDQSNAKATTSTPDGWSGNSACWVIRKDGSC